MWLATACGGHLALPVSLQCDVQFVRRAVQFSGQFTFFLLKIFNFLVADQLIFPTPVTEDTNLWDVAVMVIESPAGAGTVKGPFMVTLATRGLRVQIPMLKAII